ncbi:hypothetical protein [Dickeya dianthicola]|uniref:hypothetical protein n=1 Tax=Dickeya dianthicola TaxID=204039 RepID=UPI0003A43409|nr:hypothetical protein [Dickeya dianthicola]MCI4116058.1 hypothetical protein [Dickeya dianthicola]MCI4120777.1 hypothetical protein [Dickeya dianthicola]MCI4121869.1 hypothetical protein [Dickeya dianthicola]MCI4191867.1 hypothetical protein [Dickeya dianthicola]MCI4198346.1 hypothetical protein [Dickeya dianthicola]
MTGKTSRDRYCDDFHQVAISLFMLRLASHTNAARVVTANTDDYFSHIGLSPDNVRAAPDGHFHDALYTVFCFRDFNCFRFPRCERAINLNNWATECSVIINDINSSPQQAINGFH